jgi:hypothetical protein
MNYIKIVITDSLVQNLSLRSNLKVIQKIVLYELLSILLAVILISVAGRMI